MRLMSSYFLNAECGKLFGINRHIQHIFQMEFGWFDLNIRRMKTHQSIAILALYHTFKFVRRKQTYGKQFM